MTFRLWRCFYLFVLLFSYSSIKALDCLTKLKEGSPTCVVHVQSDKIMPGPGMNDSKCPTITENVHEWIRLSVIAFVTKPLNFQPPQKVMQQFFLGYAGPYFGLTNTNHTKNYQKITFGALFRIPPQNAIRCITVQCNLL